MSVEGQASSFLDHPTREMEKRVTDMANAILTELRIEGKLCDVVLKVGDQQFGAHKIILCGCSTYFRTLFTGPWASSEKHVHNIPGVSPEMMAIIINFAYSHTVLVTEDNVVELLAVADQFLISGIVEMCCSFLEDQLCPTNCIGIWRLVDFYYCPELKHTAFLYILYHFREIACDSEEFTELSVQQLAAIIEDNRLNVERESKVFEAILHWIDHLPDQRQVHMSVLLPKVRLGLMDYAYLQNVVMQNVFIKENNECEAIINEALVVWMDSEIGHPLSCPRLPPAILVVTGGTDSDMSATNLEAYDSRADQWVTLMTKTVRRTHHGAAVLNDSVYIIGGRISEIYFNTVFRFDLVTGVWQQVASLNNYRCFVSTAVLNGCIYAIGGFNGHTYYNTVERYTSETDQWTMMSSMQTRRCGAGSTAFNGKVYVCGGFNGHRHLSTVECYNPNTNRWTTIAPMRSCRSGLGVAAFRNRIYAVGGMFRDNYPLQSAEVYDPQTNMWSPISCMHSPRFYFGIGVVDNQLIVVGGYNGYTSVSSVECYEEDSGTWHSARNMTTSRCGLSCSVLHGFNYAESLFPRGHLSLPDPE